MEETVPHSAALTAKRVATRAGTAAPGLDPLAPTIFHTPWWLEAASNSNYDVVEVQSGGRTIGRLPFMLTPHVFGLTLCSEPQLCHSLGPALDAGPGSLTTRHNNHFEITQALIRKLPACSAYSMPLHAGALDTFAFTDAGWNTQVQFTYVLHPRGEAALWQSLRDKTRNVIRRAAERWQVTTVADPAEFVRAYECNLATRRRHNFYHRMGPVCAAALQHGRGRILAVRSECGELLAAIVVVWDQRAMYYLLTTRSPHADNSTVSLLVWHAITMANERSLVFDFDNVGSPGSRLFYSGFGGQVEPRYVVDRKTAPYRAGRWLRQNVEETRRRLAL